MEVPEKIQRKKHHYKLVKQINDVMFMYKEQKYGWIECFHISELVKLESYIPYGRTGLSNRELMRG